MSLFVCEQCGERTMFDPERDRGWVDWGARRVGGGHVSIFERLQREAVRRRVLARRLHAEHGWPDLTEET